MFEDCELNNVLKREVLESFRTLLLKKKGI